MSYSEINRITFISVSIKVLSLQKTDSEYPWLNESWESTMHNSWVVNTEQIAPGVLWDWQFKTGLVIAGDMVPWISLCLLGRVWKVLGSSEKHMGYVDQRNLYSSCISSEAAPVCAPTPESLDWEWR